MTLGAQVKGIRGADSSVRTIKDVGEYDVWSTVVPAHTPAGELMAFSYGVGANVSGSAVPAVKLDTNMRTPNQFVDESMNVYAVAIQVMRFTQLVFQNGGAATAYTTVLSDFISLEGDTLFRFHVGGDKPFAEGRITWFPEASGWAGSTDNDGDLIVSNNIPTAAAARKWEYTLPIGRIEKFWGEFSWPRGATALGGGAVATARVGIIVRLLGVRARGVQ